ncbi:hypothetical protein [Actibacterium sp. 188UL27-1]|uniref:hypothetical protein n=1 Tax=Actibacterium sp. 188UL27-1 TaxID=2786961 RepID=UPI0019585BAA|nr:hypothetical protein [Actibacterium sp. 188UL27-1]
MKRFLVAVFSLLVLGACTAEPTWAPEEQVQRALYSHAGPSTITLFTMVNNRSGSGAHSGLMVNGAHRVIFDPAGTFYHPTIPERNDVHFGIKPNVLRFYLDYHARETFHVVVQEVEVPLVVADRALQLVQEYGAVPKAMCTASITSILRQLPGFESTRSTWFPGNAMKQFAKVPGVKTRQIFDDSPDFNKDLPGQTKLN